MTDTDSTATPEAIPAGPDDIQEGPDAASGKGLDQYEEKPYDPEPQREWARAAIAGALICLLIATVLAAFVGVLICRENYDHIKGLLELIFSPIIALVGSATGFYFGGKTK